jgi:hypothetical protein
VRALQRKPKSSQAVESRRSQRTVETRQIYSVEILSPESPQWWTKVWSTPSHKGDKVYEQAFPKGSASLQRKGSRPNQTPTVWPRIGRVGRLGGNARQRQLSPPTPEPKALGKGRKGQSTHMECDNDTLSPVRPAFLHTTHISPPDTSETEHSPYLSKMGRGYLGD